MEHYEDYIGVPMDEFEYVLDDLSTFRAGLLTDEACDRVLDYALR
jgi:hypothetical protein